jgi:DNA-binding transcriptional ArsR family regulator
MFITLGGRCAECARLRENNIAQYGSNACILKTLKALPVNLMELQQLDRSERYSELYRMVGNAKRASDFLKALAHESRLMILCILAEGEKSVSELEDLLNLRQPTVSQQLARLRANGLVSARRDGKAIYYKLASAEARVVIGAIYDVFCKKPRRR